VKEVLDHPQYDRTQMFVRKNTGFYRELNARVFDDYEFEGAIEAFAAEKLISPERRRKLCAALKILLVRMVFPHVTRVVLMLDVDAKTGDMVVVTQYSGNSFNPLAIDGRDAEAAKSELYTFVKSAKYHLPASGKNEVVITV
jgi:hypothetical protein